MRVPYIWLFWASLFIIVLVYTGASNIVIDPGRAILWSAVATFMCLYSEGIARNIEKERDRKNAISQTTRSH